MCLACKTSFPGAKNMSTETLQSYFDTGAQPMLLLDVRRPDEVWLKFINLELRISTIKPSPRTDSNRQYAVSHIQGAICVGEDGGELDIDAKVGEIFKDQDKSKIMLVCYCSVRHREKNRAADLDNIDLWSSADIKNHFPHSKFDRLATEAPSLLRNCDWLWATTRLWTLRAPYSSRFYQNYQNG